MSSFKEGDSIRYVSDDKHGSGKGQVGGTVSIHHESSESSKHVATATHIGGKEYNITPHDPKYDNPSDRATMKTGLEQHHETLKNATKHKFDDKKGGTWATLSSQHAVHDVHSRNIGMPPLKVETKQQVKQAKRSGLTAGMAAKLKGKFKKSDSSFYQSLSKMDKLIVMAEELVKTRSR